MDREIRLFPDRYPMSNFLRIITPLLLAAVTLVMSACTTHYIPNTDVEDTEENRSVVQFCEKYRKAVENRDVGQLMALVSQKYYEDGGNVDAQDDLDYEGFRKYMINEFRKSKAIRYEIRYRRVVWSKEKQKVFVDYTYSASYKIPGPDGKDEWRRTVSENRLELEPHGESFLITGGM